MGLTDSLYTGLTGLDVNQAQLNVISNNIANVNTVGFKSSSAQFQTQFYQTISDGTAPSSNFGGNNPTQMGTGAELGAISQDFGQGAVQATGTDTDMAINGDGFFVVQGAQQLYTRDGAFTLNSNHQLVDSAGDFVQGYGVDKAGNVVAGQLTNLNIPIGQLTLAQATGNATFQGNLNPNGPVASGASILNSQALTDITGGTPATPTGTTNLVDLANIATPATPIFTSGQTITVQGTRGGRDLSPDTLTISGTTTVADLNAFLGQAMAIDGNVTNPTGTPTPGVALGALPGDPANSASLIITGNLGSANALELSGTAITSSSGTSPLTFADGTDVAGDTSDPTGESAYTSFEAYDSLGTPITVDLTTVLTGTSSTGTTWQFYATSPDSASAGTYVSPTGLGSIVGEGTVSFDNNGNYLSSTASTISIDRTNTGATQPLAVKLDFSNLSSLTATTSDLVLKSQDGSATGTLSSFSIGADGIIAGSFSNGLTRNLGQVALATFSNEQGLQDLGGNQFAASPASGLANITTPTVQGAGTIQAGALEQSNVDLSKQFSDLITASTGFDAASKVITTSDQLIQELLSSTNSA